MKVTVHYLFSRNNKIGSKIISWGTEHLEPSIYNTPSHAAILVNNRWVHESTLETGVRVISYQKWLEINEEVAKIPCTKTSRDYSEIKNIFQEIRDKKYDYPGVIYMGGYVAANKYFDVDIPKENKWESSNKYFCCEAVQKLAGLEPASMKAPVQMMVELNGPS